LASNANKISLNVSKTGFDLLATSRLHTSSLSAKKKSKVKVTLCQRAPYYHFSISPTCGFAFGVQPLVVSLSKCRKCVFMRSILHIRHLKG